MRAITEKFILLVTIYTINGGMLPIFKAEATISPSHASLDLVANNPDDVQELRELEKAKKNQMDKLKKNLDLIENPGQKANNNNNKSNNPNVDNSDIAEDITTESQQSPSILMIILASLGGSTVVGVGGLLVVRQLLIKFSPPQKLQSEQQIWWSKPIFGPGSIVAEILAKFIKPQIPQDAISLHQRFFTEVDNAAKPVQRMDQQKFTSQDFLFFLKVRSSIFTGIGAYKGLKYSVELLQVALKTKDSFLAIDQAELRYRSLTQQDFYDYVSNLLSQDLDKEHFKDLVQSKLQSVLPEVKTEQGKKALHSYFYHLEILSEHELGLKLLSLFKKYNLADYSILRTVADIVDRLEKSKLMDTKELIVPIMANYEAFQKLAPIIEMEATQSKPETFARIIQFLALSNRHQASFSEFQQLIAAIRVWKNSYESLLTLRQQYSPQEYKIPKEFQQVIPGEEIFAKYKNYLFT